MSLRSAEQHRPGVIPSPAPTLQAQPGATRERLAYIDGLRGLAMLMVLLFHCWSDGGYWKLGFAVGQRQFNAGSLLSFGHIGVNLFLVLSGFCLYWPYMSAGPARREPNLWQYLKKRCRRILPPYYVALVLFAAVTFLQDYHAHSLHARFFTDCLVAHFAMVHNLWPGYVLRFNGVFWTQALEFQLYLFFPILVELYRRVDKGLVLLVVFAATSAYRFVAAHSNVFPVGEDVFVLAYSVFGRLFEFAFGMFIADIVARRQGSVWTAFRRQDYVVLGLIAATIALDSYWNGLSALFDAYWGLIFGLLVLVASRAGTVLHRALSVPWLTWLGFFSYSIYLVHAPFVKYSSIFALHRHLSNNEMVIFQLVVVISAVIGISYVFHLLFERPFLTTPGNQARRRIRFSLGPVPAQREQ